MIFYKTHIGNAGVQELKHLYSVDRLTKIWNVSYNTAISRIRKYRWFNYTFNHIYVYNNKPITIAEFKKITGSQIKSDAETPKILSKYVNSKMYGDALGLAPNRAVSQWIKYPHADYVKISTVLFDEDYNPITKDIIKNTVENPPRMGAPMKNNFQMEFI